jgi:hypothetical protein
MLARMGRPFGAAAEQIAATVRASEVIAGDETSAREGQDALARSAAALPSIM